MKKAYEKFESSKLYTVDLAPIQFTLNVPKSTHRTHLVQASKLLDEPGLVHAATLASAKNLEKILDIVNADGATEAIEGLLGKNLTMRFLFLVISEIMEDYHKLENMVNILIEKDKKNGNT